MYQCKVVDFSYATSLAFNLCRDCQRCHHVPKEAECGKRRRWCGVDVVQSSIALTIMEDIEQDVDEGSTFAMSDDEGAQFLD